MPVLRLVHMPAQDEGRGVARPAELAQFQIAVIDAIASDTGAAPLRRRVRKPDLILRTTGRSRGSPCDAADDVSSPFEARADSVHVVDATTERLPLWPGSSR
jgi:hypothetical protein